MTEALFEILRAAGDDGPSVFQPTEYGRGPWSTDALHGGPVGALFARELEAIPADAPMHPARLTIELFYPVPLEALAVRTSVVRPGRRVRVLEASMTRDGDDRVLARATLQQIRRHHLDLPASVASTAGPEKPPPPRSGTTAGAPAWAYPHVAFHSHATDHRVIEGTWDAPGAATDWIRLIVPLLEGESPTPLQRVAAAADFGNGISSALPYGEYVFINPDLTVYLHRLPESEWVCLEAATWVSSEGVGQAECTLYGDNGRLGRSVQSLLLEVNAP